MTKAVEFGWEKLPEGGIEYRVQVEPELISTFEKEGFTSAIPPGLRDIRSIRITTGKVPLPNQGDLDGPKVVQAAVPDKAAPSLADTVAGTPNRALKEPGVLGNVVTTGATETAQLLDPKSGVSTPRSRYEFTPPLMSDTGNNPANGNAANANATNGNTTTTNPASTIPTNNGAANVNSGNGSFGNNGPLGTNSANTNNSPAGSSPFGNQAASGPAANNNPTDTGRPANLNEAANPKNGFWPNVSTLPQGQPTPAAAPNDTKAPADGNKSANPYRDPSVVDTFRSDRPDNRYPANSPPTFAANDGPKTDFKPEVSGPVEAKPWMPLMLALLALFASLAANVYLVWLHQEIRFKYFSLLRRLPDGSVSTI